MKLQKSFVLAAALLVVLPLAYAEDTSSNYVNGGIGDEQQTMMHSVAKEYPLHIMFSEGTNGAFIAEVQLTITDKHGKVAFELPNAGPMLYVRLPKGKYVVKAVSDGVAQSSKVTLDGKHSKTVILHWAGVSQESPQESSQE